MKHNKKRNTAFLYEALVREGTKASLEKNYERLEVIKDVLVHAFHPDMPLGRELSLYNALRVPEKDIAIDERYLNEVKNRHASLDKKDIFNEQTRLINYINKYLGHNLYENFVPFYKDLATISQIFSGITPYKEKLLLENSLIKNLQSNQQLNENLKPIDSLVYKTFVKKFNEKYSSLINEQKDLLTKYVSSFGDDGIELKIYLNEEIERLKNKISKALQTEEIKNDTRMYNKTEKLFNILQDFKSSKHFNEQMLENILKIQQFIHEVEN
jgi:hypothetical protein